MSQPGWTGSLRVLTVYISGVIFGCLGASVTKPGVDLQGSSAGLYAITWAHIASLILNWKEDGILYANIKTEVGKFAPMNLNEFVRICRLVMVIFTFLTDLGLFIYDKTMYKNVSFFGHAFGCLAGVLVGMVVLKNRKVDDWERKMKGAVWAVVTLLALCLIAVHIFDQNRFPKNMIE